MRMKTSGLLKQLNCEPEAETKNSKLKSCSNKVQLERSAA